MRISDLRNFSLARVTTATWLLLTLAVGAAVMTFLNPYVPAAAFGVVCSIVAGMSLRNDGAFKDPATKIVEQGDENAAKNQLVAENSSESPREVPILRQKMGEKPVVFGPGRDPAGQVS